MVETIDYIHSKFIIIKDIKLDNILLKTNQAESDIMICDFNLSIILSNEYSLTGDRGGTLYYVAPEVLSSQTCLVINQIFGRWVFAYIIYWVDNCLLMEIIMQRY